MTVKAKHPKIPPMAKPTCEFPSWCRGREHWIQHLIETNGWTKGAELGVWRGRTFLHLLRSCPKLKLIGIDLWQPQWQNTGPENYVDWNHTQNEEAVRNGASQFGERAIIYKMWTDEAAKLVEDNSLDFIFVDADHSTEAVRNDILTWQPKIREGGAVIGHDANWETVRVVMDELFPNRYLIGPDNAWVVWKSQS